MSQPTHKPSGERWQAYFPELVWTVALLAILVAVIVYIGHDFGSDVAHTNRYCEVQP